ncbi:MAG: response regulator, partial [Anaerolineae bacterium]
DGLAAVLMAAELVPDVAVLDIAMPGLNGIDATRRIRTASPETRVVIFSIHCTPEHVGHALEAGACGYVAKTGAPVEVVRAIRAAYQGASYLGPGVSGNATG